MKNLTIFVDDLRPDPNQRSQYCISNESDSSILGLSKHSFSEIFQIIDETQPYNIILCTANMHGKEIVSFLEHLLSKKYKPNISDIVLQNPYNRIRIIMIKFQKIWELVLNLAIIFKFLEIPGNAIIVEFIIGTKVDSISEYNRSKLSWKEDRQGKLSKRP